MSVGNAASARRRARAVRGAAARRRSRARRRAAGATGAGTTASEATSASRSECRTARAVKRRRRLAFARADVREARRCRSTREPSRRSSAHRHGDRVDADHRRRRERREHGSATRMSRASAALPGQETRPTAKRAGRRDRRCVPAAPAGPRLETRCTSDGRRPTPTNDRPRRRCIASIPAPAAITRPRRTRSGPTIRADADRMEGNHVAERLVEALRVGEEERGRA